MTEEQPDKPPQFRIPPKLYFFVAGVLAMWIFVTFFFHNPYTQAVQNDFGETRSYGEASVWTLVLFVIPMIGLVAFIAWTRRKRGSGGA
ncbi:MAG TPA: hypothetical protein VED87_08155 [Methylocystis sp.]|nr:hypothetical protein [Methylocystis sp.]